MSQLAAQGLTAQSLVETALSLSKADQAAVVVHETSEASLRWANSTMTTNGVSQSRSVSVVSVVGESVGTRTATVADAAELAELVAGSEAAARSLPAADGALPFVDGLADPEWDKAVPATDIGVFSGLARDLPRGLAGPATLYGFAHHELTTVFLGSSTGLRKRFTQPTGSVEINAKQDKASVWAGRSTEDFADFDTDGLLAELSSRISWSETRIDLPAGRYDTVLPPGAVADLMIYLYWCMEGRSAQEGHSPFSRAGGTRVGERLGELGLSLYSDPAEPGLACAPFVATTESGDQVSVFDNGLDIGRVDWIKDGVIERLAYPRALAAEYGQPVSTPADNLVLTGGRGSTEDLVAGVERGLLLTTLWYIRMVDPAALLLTGLTRDGVYLVEDGKVAGEVNNFRFNESPLDLLRRATHAGESVRSLPREWKDYFQRTTTPALRVPDFFMSSVSQAT
ncbi:MAG: metallopeptidase TldD-related protein [Segniliparus sp.]|uniref:metallopeptidase TldD-related protein n=1 Tax=Segniliparus sp. TaxID=2804064 RepID=UPI003F3C3942